MQKQKNFIALSASAAAIAAALFIASSFSGAYAAADPEDIRVRGAIASLQHTGVHGQESQYILQGYWKYKNMNDDDYFHAKFTMVNVDGSNHHTMWLKQFRLTADPIVDGNTLVYAGTIDIWAFHADMMPAPAIIEDGDNVPVKISIVNNNVIVIEVDHTVNGHFGDTPIYGTVTESNV